MRTTITVEDEAYDQIKIFAEANGVSIGKAIEMMARRTIQGPPRIAVDPITGVAVFQGPPVSTRPKRTRQAELELIRRIRDGEE